MLFWHQSFQFCVLKKPHTNKSKTNTKIFKNILLHQLSKLPLKYLPSTSLFSIILEKYFTTKSTCLTGEVIYDRCALQGSTDFNLETITHYQALTDHIKWCVGPNWSLGYGPFACKLSHIAALIIQMSSTLVWWSGSLTGSVCKLQSCINESHDAFSTICPA